MTADLVIIAISFFGCITFVVFFFVLIRRSPTHPMQAIFLSFIPALFITMILGWVVSPVTSAMFASLFFYTLLTAFYILGIYLNIDSSLHVRILREVAIAGRKGLTYKDLLKRYNKESIVQKRIAWFVNSGEIEKIGDTYYRRRHFSSFLIIEKMLGLLSKLYGSKTILS